MEVCFNTLATFFLYIYLKISNSYKQKGWAENLFSNQHPHPGREQAQGQGETADEGQLSHDHEVRYSKKPQRHNPKPKDGENHTEGQG